MRVLDCAATKSLCWGENSGGWSSTATKIISFPFEAPLGALTPELLAPLDAYFETHIASWRYAALGYRGWSLVDGFRAAALSYAVALWLFTCALVILVTKVGVGRFIRPALAHPAVRAVVRVADAPRRGG